MPIVRNINRACALRRGVGDAERRRRSRSNRQASEVLRRRRHDQRMRERESRQRDLERATVRRRDLEHGLLRPGRRGRKGDNERAVRPRPRGDGPSRHRSSRGTAMVRHLAVRRRARRSCCCHSSSRSRSFRMTPWRSPSRRTAHRAPATPRDGLVLRVTRTPRRSRPPSTRTRCRFAIAGPPTM